MAHPRSPKVPTTHMNTRMIATSKSWFGGGADLTPMAEGDDNEAHFHAALKAACDAHDAGYYYPRYKTWCDEYFYLPHRGETRGVGGIFYDYLSTGDWERDFAFTRKASARASSTPMCPIVERHMNMTAGTRPTARIS